ncbi:glycosyltransferase family 25 protein [Pseudohoeflea coraliihabitans]|uniref:Glycosyltransferase family 25 protein n=1 Tax=Pseudohoeflea coraliihabitans TaxID=2860393 RepID=A0ABS6WJ92_9HYPH|nr:hypothetical protein [Pseudohoeflea sp. DP4N28-3]MBW3096004.1 hypothetical protein [Pseudohoeflea sp. DP4N28-3]
MPAADAMARTPIVMVLTCAISPPQRLRSARSELAGAVPGVPVRVVDGLVEEDPAVDALFDAGRAQRLSKRPPTRREVAVYGTHRLAWQALLDSGRTTAIILEDDFKLVAPAALEALLAHLPGVLNSGLHMLKLFDYPRTRNGGWALERKFGDVSLVQWARPRAGMVGYLITAEGARRLLARERVFRVVDEDTKYFWELGLDIWSLRPLPVADGSDALGGSLLDAARNCTRRRRRLRRSLLGMVLTLHRRNRSRLAFLAAVLSTRNARLRRFATR